MKQQRPIPFDVLLKKKTSPLKPKDVFLADMFCLAYFLGLGMIVLARKWLYKGEMFGNFEVQASRMRDSIQIMNNFLLWEHQKIWYR